MATGTIDEHARCDQRFSTDGNGDIGCVIGWTVAEGDFCDEVRMIDVSYSGARFISTEMLAPNQRLRMTVRLDDPEFVTTTDAIVRWVEPRTDANWMVGCELIERLPDELITRLAVAGQINRRKDTRFRLDVVGYLRRELESVGEVSVRVEDFSAGGFRVFSPTPARVGERVLLKVRDDDGLHPDVAAKVAWQVEIAAGCYLGCTFVNRRGFEIIARVARNNREPSPSLVVEEGSLAWIWFGLGTVLTLALLRLFGALLA